MRSADQVAEFVAAALNSGHSRADTAAALGRAGWAEAEIQAGLDAWSAEDFRPPVPRPRTYLSAREAFIYGLLYASLVVTAWYAIDIGYALINAFWEEDTGQTYHGSIDGVRWWVAV